MIGIGKSKHSSNSAFPRCAVLRLSAHIKSNSRSISLHKNSNVRTTRHSHFKNVKKLNFFINFFSFCGGLNVFPPSIYLSASLTRADCNALKIKGFLPLFDWCVWPVVGQRECLSAIKGGA